MGSDRLVFGLLDTSPDIADPLVASKYRDLTLCWSRYGYGGSVIEAADVEGILRESIARGYSFCLIQSYGHIIREVWIPGHWGREDFHALLERTLAGDPFLVRGWIVGDEQEWYGLDPCCLLVNLETYRRLGAPPLAERTAVPRCAAVLRPGGDAGIESIAALEPREGPESGVAPRRFGWQLVALSLRNGISVRAFDRAFAELTLSLEGQNAARTRAFARYLRGGLSQYDRSAPDRELGAGQIQLLDLMDTQTRNARRGVFLFNIEPYLDVEAPPADFDAPVATLYSVAAGFKPNRILATHGFDALTRVVFFDYSARALEIRRHIVDEWNGVDFPAFIRHLLAQFPCTDTHYFMWADLSPDQVDWSDVERLWAEELERWGGADRFARHWRAYRGLRHEYLCLDIVGQAQELLDHVRPERRAVVWWSNAFFTMCSNWQRTTEERRERYEAWAQGLAERAPEALVYGSDYNNVSVNSVRAGEYWGRYEEAGGTALEPCNISRLRIRM